MARLNETTQPAVETVDALKRRFLRQNREIAKANSTQSLRIRNLEGEVARLLGENVALREQVIKLHYEIESNAAKPDTSQINSFKKRLEIKLSEMGALVEELGQSQWGTTKRSHQKRKSLSGATPPKRSPKQRVWKDAQALSDLMGEAEGRLPPIMEDKCFPRQTMNSDELHEILAVPADLMDSPDLGPPPVAHFEEGDPIKPDSQDDPRVADKNVLDTESTDKSLSVNLETRRRRRESSHPKDTPSQNIDRDTAKNHDTNTNSRSSSQPVKVGTKRKLNVRGEDEQPLTEREWDGFQFERKEATNAGADKVGKTTSSRLSDRLPTRTERLKGTAPENTASVSSAGRRALGPKNANTDPQSPAKSSVVGANDKPIPIRETLLQKAKDKDRHREKTRARTSIEPTGLTAQDTKIKALDKVTPCEPETPAPAPLDLLSPTSTEPSARQEGRGDTPPPPDLGPNTGTGSFGRASRRSRGSVSYAEPSLRDKMRRPTKELVDAVGAKERARQAHAMDMDNIESTSATIKMEEDRPETLPDWKTMRVEGSHGQKERQKAETTSPLSKKAAATSTDLPLSMMTDRKRRTSTLTKVDDGIRPSKTNSGAAAVIAALAVPKRGQEPSGQSEEAGDDGSQRQSDRTSIFDFTGSSPESKGPAMEPVEDSKPLSRSARRHSSVPALSDHGRGSLAISRRSRRESMM